MGPAATTQMIVDAARSVAHTAASPPAMTHSATVATSAGATPTVCIPERSTGSPIRWLAAQARTGRAVVLTSSTTAMRRQARRTAARSARRKDRPVAKTRTASAISMPFPAATARPGEGAATPAAPAAITKTMRKRSDVSAAEGSSCPASRTQPPIAPSGGA